MSARICVRNSQRALKVDRAGLQQFAQRALGTCETLPPKGDGGLTSLPEIAVHLVSDRRIGALHQQFMRIAGATDVITFQHGEIFISVPTAARQAAEYATSLGNELRLYLIHGLLHLHGYDDGSARDAQEMDRLQIHLLRTLSSAGAV